MNNGYVRIEEWIDHVFDHGVREPPWHFDLDVPYLDPGPVRVATLVAETFENSADLLRRFTDSQLNQGFLYLIDPGSSDYVFALLDGAVPTELRLRAFDSFVPLFEQTMASRCSPHLSHLDEPGAGPLNGACYMWWDVLPLSGKSVTDREDFHAQVLSVLRRILAIPHDACRESALHGLGHWQAHCPAASGVVDDFLLATPGLRDELVRYAEAARTGCVN